MRFSSSVAFLVPLMAAAILPASAKTLSVPSQYPYIQAAVNAAKPGDTVQVSPKAGSDPTYHENVSITTDRITLKTKNGATLDGTGRGSGLFSSYGISITNASNVTVSGFTIQHYDIGLYTLSTQAHILSNTLTANLNQGVFIDFGSAATDVEQNTITNNGSPDPNPIYNGLPNPLDVGVEIYGGDFTLSRNTISGNRGGGISVITGSAATSGSPIAPSTMSYNTVTCNFGEGITVFNSENLTISYNVISSNKRSDFAAPGDAGGAGDGIGIFGDAGLSDNLTISYNQLIGNSLDGLFEGMNSSAGNIVISYNVASANVSDGIEIGSGGNTVSYCVAVGNAIGPVPFGVRNYDAEDHTDGDATNHWTHDVFGTSNPPGLGRN